MKVLHIGKYFPPESGGMESHLYNLAPCLGKRVDLDVVVFTRGKKSTVEERETFRLHRLAVHAMVAGQPISWKLPGYLRKIPADIVHIHHPNPYALLAFFLSRHPGKLVITYHSDIVRQKLLGAMIRPLLHSVWQKTYAFSANSAPFVDSSPVLSLYRDIVHLVPHGISPDVYLKPESKESMALRAKWGVPIVLCVGRLVPYKGFIYAVNAMDELRKRKVAAHLFIVGEGPLHKQMQQHIQQMGLQDWITMTGRVEDTLPYYQAADVFVFPSCENNETLGLAQVEAMMCGKPVINTALPTGVPHVSLHRVTGLTVPTKDSLALAEAMIQLLQDDPLRLRMGESARVRALAEYTAEKSADLTFEIYRKICAAM